jgi:hypothetical protein
MMGTQIMYCNDGCTKCERELNNLYFKAEPGKYEILER